LPFGWIEDGAVDKVLHLGWSPIYLRLEMTTHEVTWCARLWLVLVVLWQAASCALLRF
jgi:hypothetical protein